METLDPLFTVVIPVRNGATRILRTLASLKMQTLHDFEVIVVDDASTDATEAIVRGEGDCRVRYVTQAQAGVSSARNLGASLARGSYLAFLDTDDEPEPGWLEAFAEMLREPRNAVGCVGTRVVTSDDPSGTICLPSPLGPLFDDIDGLFLAGSFALRREAFHLAGGYEASLHYSENTELAFRLATLCGRNDWQVVCRAEALITVRLTAGPERWTPERLRDRFSSAQFLLDRHEERMKRDPAAYARYWGIAGVAALRLGRRIDARRCFWRAVVADPFSLRHQLRLGASFLPFVHAPLS